MLVDPLDFDFKKIWWINEFGRLTRYTLLIVDFIGTRKCGILKGWTDDVVVDY